MATKLGIIGDKCFGYVNLFDGIQEVSVSTEWGEPSCPLKFGTLFGVPVVTLQRGGNDACLSASKINFRANIQAIKDIGCTHVLSVSSLASLQEEIHLSDFVIPDQFIDFTTQRQQSFGLSRTCNARTRNVMLDPFDVRLRKLLVESCLACQFPFYPSGTAITVEGPRFPSRAESRMFRAWGADVTNMCLSTEVALANELDLPFAYLGVVTDFDYWNDDDAPVLPEKVNATMTETINNLKILFERVILGADLL